MDGIRYNLQQIDEIRRKKYRLDYPWKEREWGTYEQEFSQRIKTAMKDLEPLIDKVVSTIRIIHCPRYTHSMSLQQRLKLLMIRQLVWESNRMFAIMLGIFSMVLCIDASYRTVERLYSDEEIALAVHNPHMLILKKNGKTESR